MRRLFVLLTTLTVFQVSNVYTTDAATSTYRDTAQRTAVTRGLSARKRTAPEVAEKLTDGGEEEVPPRPRPAFGRLARAARDEAGKRAAGAADAATEVLRLSSDSLGLFGRLVREQVRNLRRLAVLKFELLSGLGRGLTDGAANLMYGAGAVGGEGGRALSGALRTATGTGITAARVAGKLLDAPFRVADHGLRVAKRVAAVPAKLTKTASDAARHALSVVGVHSEEDDDDDVAHPVEIVDDESADGQRPTAAKTKKIDSRRR